MKEKKLPQISRETNDFGLLVTCTIMYLSNTKHKASSSTQKMKSPLYWSYLSITYL